MYISLANKIVVVLIVIVIIIVVLSTMIIDSLSVPAVRLSTVGRGTLPVDGACIWNDLPSHITSSPSLLTFKQRLKHLFRLSYPGLSFLLRILQAVFSFWSLK